MSTAQVILLSVLFVSFAGLFYLIARLITQKKTTYEERLHKYVLFDDKKVNQKGRIFSLLTLGQRLDQISFVRKQEELLLQAGMEWTPGEFFVIRLLGVLVTSTFLLLNNLPVVLVFLIGVVVYFIPPMLAKRKRRKRLLHCSIQLSEALGTMANALRAGFSFMQALQLIADETPDPLGTELKKALFDMKYGVTLEEAFTQLMKRLPNRELEIAIEALLIQRSSGGNLAVLLETIQETIRGRIRIKEETHALTAQGRLSSWIVTLLPIILGIYLKLARPQYFDELLAHPLGWVMLGAAACGVVMGWFFIQRIVRIEV